jgi:hypothetical protein
VLRRSLAAWLLVIALVVLWACSAASAETLFTGGFNSSNLSEWKSVQAIPGRVTITEETHHEGVGRFEVRAGDKDPFTGAQRAAVLSGLSFKAGDVRYFRLRTKISSWDYSHSGVLWQLHDQGPGAPISLQLAGTADSPKLELGSGGTEYWNGSVPSPTGWFELIVRVEFGKEGSVKVWLNGAPQTLLNGKVAYSGVDTLGEGPDYDELGISRSSAGEGTAVVYHDEYRITDTAPRILNADFGHGDLGEWDFVQAIPGRITVVEHTGRFEVQVGDKDPYTGSQRAEVLSGLEFHQGDERYFHIRAKIGSWDWTPNHWGIIWQLHDQGNGSPPLALQLANNGTTKVLWLVGYGNTIYWEAPVPTLTGWFEVLVGVEFGKEGWSKVWLNGTPQTLSNGKATYGGINTLGEAPDYDKLGIYRSSASEGTTVIYHDDYWVTESWP